jgi:site-specific DNA-methyltransferase (adenine-specific)
MRNMANSEIIGAGQDTARPAPKSNTITCGDCLEVMQAIPDKSVDMILCDLPYGTTSCKWDSIINLPSLWYEYQRIMKQKGAILLFASQPFTTVLGMSGIKYLRYEWAWDKKFAGNFVQAKRMPLKVHENILVFCIGELSPNYYPQMTKRNAPIKSGGNSQNEGKAIRMKPKDYVLNKTYEYKFPETVIEFNVREGRGLHPTQKPVALFEYLIRTYTNEGNTVLDNCIGSGTTAIACINTNRNFIGIEKEEKYCRIAEERIHALRSPAQNTMEICHTAPNSASPKAAQVTMELGL